MEKAYTLDPEEIFPQSREKLVVMPYRQDDTPSHDHHFFELVYVTGGTGLHTLNGESGLLSRGDYFIIDFGSVHSYSDCRDLTLVNCLFLPEIIDETLHGCRSFDTLLQHCLISYYTPCFHQAPADRVYRDEDDAIAPLLRGMQAEYDRKSAGFEEVLKCRLVEILIHVMRRVLSRNTRSPKSAVVLAAIRYVNREYARPVSLGRFCAESHFSLQYISRKFKQETGITFQEYLQKKRIEKSCELLVQSDLPVSEVAQAVGYTDAKFFSALFRRLVSLSPREYRKRFMQTL